MIPLFFVPLLSLAVEPPTLNEKCKNIFTRIDPKPESVNIPGFEIYFCDDKPLIYTSDKKDVMVQYSLIRCTGGKVWEAIETDDLQHEVKIIGDNESGTLKCKDNTVITCKDTRLNLDDMNGKGMMPTFNSDTRGYSCAHDSFHLYLKQKFTFGVKSGHYIQKDSIKCEEGNMTARFAHIEGARQLDKRDTITCKRFECDDTLVPSLSYFNILKMDNECPSGEGATCIKPNFYSESPCGEMGHELTVTAKKDAKQRIHWVKDHHIECRGSRRLYFTDVLGKTHEIKEGDTLLCRMPKDCPPLLTNPLNLPNFGCKDVNGLFDCYDIDNSSIPNHHLSKFDGNCFGGHVLKIAPTGTKVNFLVELEYVECRYGKWKAHLLPNSLGNTKLKSEKEQKIDEYTNLFCKRRVDFTYCDLPPSHCSFPHTADCARVATKDNKLLTLTCEDESMQLVEHIEYSNGTIQVVELRGTMVCDRGTRKWSSMQFPYRGLYEDENKQKNSFAVCAKKVTCDRDRNNAPRSDCENRVACQSFNTTPPYWTRVRCPPFYELKLQNAGVSTGLEVMDEYFCHEKQWKVWKGGKERKTLSNKDNVFCQEIGVLEVLDEFLDKDGKEKFTHRTPSTPHTSGGCLPTKLDSICPEMRYTCEPVITANPTQATEWKCSSGKTLWYIEYERGRETASKASHLKCDAGFWKVHYKDSDKKAIPNPHANFICLANGDEYDEVSKETSEDTAKKSAKKDEAKAESIWDAFPIGEGIVALLATVIFCISVYIVYRGHREEKEMKKRKELLS